jgi:hypothetical protein
MPKKVEVTTNEARQATTRPRAMIWVLLGSLFLCAMAGVGSRHGMDQSSSAVPVIGTFQRVPSRPPGVGKIRGGGVASTFVVPSSPGLLNAHG